MAVAGKKNSPTISDIAKALDVTPSTVSRALHNHPRISQTTKEAVWRTAREMNYQHNHLAAALRRGHSSLLGVMVPTINRSFFSSVVRGIEEVANEAGYAVMVCQSHEAQAQEEANIQVLLRSQVDGMIVSVGKGTRDFAHFQQVMDRDTPLIFFDRVPEELAASAVVIDDYRGAYLATRHLIEQGCRQLVHLAGSPHLNIYRDRQRGFEDAHRLHGLPLDPVQIVPSSLQLEAGRACVEELLARQQSMDGIFSASDYAAVGAMQALKARGIRIPEDVAIAGFSNEVFTTLVEPALTTVEQHSLQMGRTTARLFLEQFDHQGDSFVPRRTVLSPELIVRASSLRRPPP